MGPKSKSKLRLLSVEDHSLLLHVQKYIHEEGLWHPQYDSKAQYDSKGIDISIIISIITW